MAFIEKFPDILYMMFGIPPNFVNYSMLPNFHCYTTIELDFFKLIL